jgi:SNF2 family DNA or RNA helicase
MHLTPHQARYIAHDLTLQHAGGGLDRLIQAMFKASVDLNPHQIEAAVFALRLPLSKGVLLADEVGLGKTIEAGIVLCQYWAERKRQLFALPWGNAHTAANRCLQTCSGALTWSEHGGAACP